MSLSSKTVRGLVVCGVLLAAATTVHGRPGIETFTATATVKTAGGASATAPVTITIERLTPQSEADTLVAAFKAGGVAGLRKALEGVAPTGSVQLGAGKPTPTRLTIERATDKGRLLTIVTDRPVLFLGAGVPSAKPKEGYDLGVIDIEVDAKGNGSGTLASAAKVTVNQGMFVVQDYGSDLIQLTGVSKK